MAGGRPKKVVDYALVEKLANIQCTEVEISEILEISTRTLQKDKEFLRIYKKGLESGKSSLRRLQWKAAEKGNPTMLVWLGKQYLNQKDRSEVEQHNINTEMPTIIVDDSVESK
jgi:hypothetical protein